MTEMYNDILPLYKMLHAYVRFHLSKFYGEDKVELEKPIPAHLLGE